MAKPLAHGKATKKGVAKCKGILGGQFLALFLYNPL
jgi:hypothetical protein